LRWIVRKHPRTDFLFRSHAPAQAYPFCYTADDERELALLPLRYYTDSFIAAASVVQPRWAIPFASNLCHLHPESLAQNAFLVSPYAVKEAFARSGCEVECVPMVPGDSWSREAGFSLSLRHDVGGWATAVAQLAEEKAGLLAQEVRNEQALAPIDFEAFSSYMNRFARAVPWWLRLAFPARVTFEMPDRSYSLVDLGRALVERRAAIPSDTHSVVRVNPHLLRDAIEKAGLNLVGISKRIRVHLRRGGLTCDAAFWGLLTIYELGYLPIRNVLTVRGLVTLATRWREMAGYIRILLEPSRSLELAIDSTEPGRKAS
jgi:UDP-MurNAc hydroxylase